MTALEMYALILTLVLLTVGSLALQLYYQKRLVHYIMSSFFEEVRDTLDYTIDSIMEKLGDTE